MMRNMTMTLGQGEPAAGPWQVVPLARLVGMLRPGDSARAGRPWVQSDMAEAERRGIEHDGGDTAAVSFWHLWMAEELSFHGPAATVDTGEGDRGGHAGRFLRSGERSGHSRS